MFENRLALISGGSSRLGKALAGKLHAKGARLVLLARNREKLEEAKARIEEENGQGPEIRVVAVDAADKEALGSALGRAVEERGCPDILINSAGILREGRVADLCLETFEQVMGINYFGTLYCTHALLPHMLKRGSGRIVNISSIAGRMGVFGYGAYCSSKYAVAGLTRTLFFELAGTGVHVHIAYPPEFDSPMVDDLETYRTPENRAMAQTIPVMRADRVAEAIVWGMRKNRFEIIPGWPSRVVARLDQWFPALSSAVALARIRRAR